ncbi:MAG: aminopeptidase P family protein [Clostridia bacterium]|nr:aminopeptidase P family protein [Clostridia bacterium]
MVERIHKIQEKLDSFEGAIIRSDANRFYLTGFNSSAGIVLIFKNSAYFLIDFRYFEIAEKTVSGFEVILLKNTFAQINELCKENNIKTLYTECDNIDFNSFFNYKKSLESELSGDNKIGELLLNLRSIKDEKEISLIKKAQEITDDTFNYILNNISAGSTEKEIALNMEFYLRKQGSEGVSFDFIVVSGKNSSLPHGVPTDKKIEKGDFITMDFGAVFCGYRSDMTRTVCVANPTDEQKYVYDTVLKAQNIAFENIKPDVKCLDVDKAARDFIESKFEGCFGHGLGHSVGIEIHENPSFNTRCETPLQKGMVLTVEPGIYLKNKFGVRIEDMVVITENGFENITNSPKNLIIL